MKPKKVSNSKLKLEKKAIINLTETNQLLIKGGIAVKGEALTTSFFNCTGILCCVDNTTSFVTK